jgi:prophage regulatory protein
MTRLIRLPEVVQRSGLPRSSVYCLIKRSQFPAPVKISVRSSAWRLDLVDRWIEERSKTSRSSTPEVRP